MRRLYFVLAAVLILALLAGCGGAAAPAATAIDVRNLPSTVDVATVRSLQDRPDVVLFDVREPYEYQAGHIPGVKLIPMNDVPNRINEIPRDKTVILTCRSGNRSGQVADFLRKQGFTNVHNMQGGILAWQQAGYPIEK
ncbi:MAG: rhodanese-like domain-containing protein [Anaerolineae bacterium]|nr:rhodanese-like domain-containing protein [Anaerolineae bacterium]